MSLQLTPWLPVGHPINCHLPREAIPYPLSAACSPLSLTYFELCIYYSLYSLSHPDRMETFLFNSLLLPQSCHMVGLTKIHWVIELVRN